MAAPLRTGVTGQSRVSEGEQLAPPGAALTAPLRALLSPANEAMRVLARGRLSRGSTDAATSDVARRLASYVVRYDGGITRTLAR